MTEKQSKLNPKQALFVKHYLDCMNGSEALRKAGYNPKHANKTAFQLLSNPLIKASIDNIRNDIDKTKAIVVAESKRELVESLRNTMTFADKLRCLCSIVDSQTASNADKMKAIEIMNKMEGHNAPEKSINLNIDLVDNDIAKARLERLSCEPHNTIEGESQEVELDNMCAT